MLTAVWFWSQQPFWRASGQRSAAGTAWRGVMRKLQRQL